MCQTITLYITVLHTNLTVTFTETDGLTSASSSISSSGLYWKPQHRTDYTQITHREETTTSTYRNRIKYTWDRWYQLELFLNSRQCIWKATQKEAERNTDTRRSIKSTSSKTQGQFNLETPMSGVQTHCAQSCSISAELQPSLRNHACILANHMTRT